MSGERLFIDTAYIQAPLNKRDQYHPETLSLFARIRADREARTTEGVFFEVGAALRAINRPGAEAFIRKCYETPNMHVVSVDTSLLLRSLDLYSARQDKAWSLVDCVSFNVMEERRIHLAATTDHHFLQAGFQALMSID